MRDAPCAPDVFRGRRVLVVEDEYLVADDVARELELAGAEVLGPVASVPAAMALLDAGPSPDIAILDVNLGVEQVFPVAERLRSGRIPFIFATGYDLWTLPTRLDAEPRCEKPVDLASLGRALLATTGHGRFRA